MKKAGYVFSNEIVQSAHIIILDDNHELNKKYGDGRVPCFVIFKDGKLRDTFYGYIDAKHLAEKINKVVNDV